MILTVVIVGFVMCLVVVDTIVYIFTFFSWTFFVLIIIVMLVIVDFSASMMIILYLWECSSLYSDVV